MRRRRRVIALVVASVLLLGVAATPASAAPPRAGVFFLNLTGEQEATATCAPPEVCGDPDATGQMLVVVIPRADKVCFVTRWSDIDGSVVAAHIHVAPEGVAGPIVVPLFMGTFDGTDRTRGCVSGEGFADDIVANPDDYYVNIHSTVFPAGAIRDQLA